MAKEPNCNGHEYVTKFSLYYIPLPTSKIKTRKVYPTEIDVVDHQPPHRASRRKDVVELLQPMNKAPMCVEKS